MRLNFQELKSKTKKETSVGWKETFSTDAKEKETKMKTTSSNNTRYIPEV